MVTTKTQFRSCVSQGGHPGLSVLISLLVSVDVKLYWTVLRHWSQLVPNICQQTSEDFKQHNSNKSPHSQATLHVDRYCVRLCCLHPPQDFSSQILCRLSIKPLDVTISKSLTYGHIISDLVFYTQSTIMVISGRCDHKPRHICVYMMSVYTKWSHGTHLKLLNCLCNTQNDHNSHGTHIIWSNYLILKIP